MPENWIRLTETVYSGGTVVASEGQEISPEQAYALGVNDDGTLDRTLSTDQLRERALSLAAPVAAEEPPADAGDAPVLDDQATVTGHGSDESSPPAEHAATTEPPVPAPQAPAAPAVKATRARKL